MMRVPLVRTRIHTRAVEYLPPKTEIVLRSVRTCRVRVEV